MKQATRCIPRAETTDSEALVDCVELTFDHRYRRRIKMTTLSGVEFLLKLPQARALRDGDVLVLDDQSRVRVVAADEAVMCVTAADAHVLMRLAWHIGNRHLPAEIHADYLLLAEDHVIAEMIRGLGGKVELQRRPFHPEGGAYDHGH
ncbi:MAG: urease accessory protein UreE [Pseudomonadota bacterium]